MSRPHGLVAYMLVTKQLQPSACQLPAEGVQTRSCWYLHGVAYTASESMVMLPVQDGIHEYYALACIAALQLQVLHEQNHDMQR